MSDGTPLAVSPISIYTGCALLHYLRLNREQENVVDNRWISSGASLCVKRRKLTAGKSEILVRGITLERSRFRQIPTNIFTYVAR